MKWSAFTLVSRDNELLKEAALSVYEQEPDEYTAYIDKVKLPDSSRAEKILEEVGAVIKYQDQVFKDDHYINANLTVYRAILEAKHSWVLDCDDDDQVIGQVPDLMFPYCASGVGAVYGHKLRKRPNGSTYFVTSWDLYSPFEVAGMRGSVILYNQHAFRSIYKNLDVFRGRVDDSLGYFWEYKIAYWMLRAGYVLKSCNDVIMLQNQNMERHAKMRQLKDAWYDFVVPNRDKLELI